MNRINWRAAIVVTVVTVIVAVMVEASGASRAVVWACAGATGMLLGFAGVRIFR